MRRAPACNDSDVATIGIITHIISSPPLPGGRIDCERDMTTNPGTRWRSAAGLRRVGHLWISSSVPDGWAQGIACVDSLGRTTTGRWSQSYGSLTGKKIT
jgi:hypothetical protein